MPTDVTTLANTETPGFAAGSGGSVTQITSASTGVTLSTKCGKVTTVALTTAAGAEELFTVTNTKVALTSVVVPTITGYAGAGTPVAFVKTVAAGSFALGITNLHASAALDAAVSVNFVVLEAPVS